VARPPLGPDPIFEQNLRDLGLSPWLDALGEDSRDSLARIAARRIHPDGATLFRRGDPGDRVWLICSGSVQASRIGADGRELVVHVAGPGETPGQVDVLDDGARSLDAIVVGGAETISLPAQAVREELLCNPAALMRLAVDLVQIVRYLDSTISDQVLLDLDGRLAKLLLSRRLGDDSVQLGLNQTMVANQLGVARQSMNRSLGVLARRGLIAVEAGGRKVRILDAEGLLTLAAGELTPPAPDGRPAQGKSTTSRPSGSAST